MCVCVWNQGNLGPPWAEHSMLIVGHAQSKILVSRVSLQGSLGQFKAAGAALGDLCTQSQTLDALIRNTDIHIDSRH